MKTSRNIFWGLLAGVFLVQCGPAEKKTSFPEEFSQWRGPDRNGIYPAENLLAEWPQDGPEVIWDFTGLGMGYSSAAVTKSRIYTAGTTDSTSFLYAIGHDGTLVWKTELGPEWTKTFPGIRSTPLIYGELGYVVNGLGVLFCFDTETGKITWKKELLEAFNAPNIMHGINENLLIDGNKLFCTPGGPEANIVALDKNTGEVIWTSKGSGEQSAYCSPKLIRRGGNTFLITMTLKYLVSVNAETGAVAWTKELEDDEFGIHAQTPLYRNGMLFVQDGYEKGCFLLRLSEDGMSYEEVWKNTMLDETNGHAVLIGDRVYGSGETKKRFVCLDWNTGETLYSTRDISEGTVIAADGMLYCCTYKGDLSLVKPTDQGFEIISSFKLPGEDNEHIAHPVIADGKLYIRHRDLLRVYSISNEKKLKAQS